MFVSMNMSAFMHLFTRRSSADAKVLSGLKEFGHVSPGGSNTIIVTIDGFEVLGHMLIHLSFEILNRARGAAIKVIVNLDGHFFHAFKVASLASLVKPLDSIIEASIKSALPNL